MKIIMTLALGLILSTGCTRRNAETTPMTDPSTTTTMGTDNSVYPSPTPNTYNQGGVQGTKAGSAGVGTTNTSGSGTRDQTEVTPPGTHDGITGTGSDTNKMGPGNGNTPTPNDDK